MSKTPKHAIDLEGQIIGRWKPLYRCERAEGSKQTFWMCECQCEKKTTKPVNIYTLLRAKEGDPTGSMSCGCYGAEQRHKSVTTHGESGTRTYETWCSMKTRCFNTKSEAWRYYGGRQPEPVRVCEGFMKYECFKEVMGERPPDLSIDRINNDGPDSNYSCGQCGECVKKGWSMNCRWATVTQQVRNRSITVKVEVAGEQVPLAEVVEQMGTQTSYDNVGHRLSNGWPLEEAVRTPTSETVTVLWQGKTLPLADLCRELSLSYSDMHHRVKKKGMTVEEAIASLSRVKRHNKLEWEGELLTLNQIAKKNNVGYGSLTRRYRSGVPLKDAVAELAAKGKREVSRQLHNWKGEELSLSEIARKENIDRGVLQKRVRVNRQSLEEAVAEAKELRREQVQWGEESLSLRGVARSEGVCPTSLARRIRKGQSPEQAVAEMQANLQAKAAKSPPSAAGTPEANPTAPETPAPL